MTDYKYRGTETIAEEEAWERARQPYRPAAKRRGAGKALCGTLGGHSAHRYRRETPCDPCRYAYNTYQQMSRNSAPPTGRRNNPRPVCGTLSGYRKHQRDSTTPCFQCRVAFAAYMTDYRARKKDAHPKPAPAPSDMSAAHKALRARLAERIEDLEDLIAAGVPDEEAATRAGWPTIAAAARALQRAGHPYGNRLDRTSRATRRQQAKDAA